MTEELKQRYSDRTLLAVLAHPDDETFGIGGTLAMYAQQGAQVYLVCATRGEVGEMDSRYLEGFNSIAERREYELCCAVDKLGLRKVYFLNYRDSGMPGSPENQHPQALTAQPVEKVAGEIASYIRKLKPQVVITFDPYGGYGHPDHIAIHNATNLAVEQAANPEFQPQGNPPPHQVQRLFYQVIPRTMIRLGVLLMQLLGKDPSKFGTNGDIDLKKIAGMKFPIHASVNYLPVAKLRDEAANCHESQGGRRQSNGIIGWLRRLVGSRELFMQAFPIPEGKGNSRDLFDGVTT
ncbi:MAG: GlcNAc-PI de-N-acetylase [Anaerolineae bacterium]|nr:GlcNAc-PI de-N-acetylase [Anaerolineae bacterium]